MILKFYNLREQPFGATPDTRYLFSSATHREALASLLYGVKEGRGFIGLIAKPGMGKTTLLFRSLNQLKESSKTVFLFQTISTPIDFLRTLLRDLGVEDVSGGLEELQARLTQILVEHSQRGQKLIVVIDEAQNLDNDVLELVRMLSNFETSKEKLIHIILAGQPQLAKKLASPDLLQLRQRISILAHLDPFTAEETEQYVNHRLRVAGYPEQQSLFTRSAIRIIAEHSGGIPRNINTLCFNALSIGAALKRRSIDADILREVIADLELEPLTGVEPIEPPLMTRAYKEDPRSTFGSWAVRLALVGLAGLAIWIGVLQLRNHQESADVSKSANTTEATSPQVEPDVLSTDEHSINVEEQPLTLVALPSSPIPETPRRHENRRAASPLRSSINRNEVLVRPGMTFYGICGELFSPCTISKVRELHRLNPWLSDSNYVKVGDVLVVPPPTDLTEAAGPTLTTP